MNHEIVAAGAPMVFERLGDDIALQVPARTTVAETDDDQIARLDNAAALRHRRSSVTAGSRRAGAPDAPDGRPHAGIRLGAQGRARWLHGKWLHRKVRSVFV